MKKELIDRIVEREEHEHFTLKQILEEELPDFQRIDWERLRDCFEKASNGYVSSHLHVAVKEYNSTLPTALVPLPKEMPTWFDKKVSEWMNNSNIRLNQVWHELISHYGTPPNNLQPLPKEMPKDILDKWMNEATCDFDSIWEELFSRYGTPEPKPNLPTVEELAKEIESHGTKIFSFSVESIAKNLHDKYALPTHQWWQDLKEGDKFMYAGEAYEYYGYEVNIRGEVTLWGKSTWKFRLSQCTPYTTPSAQDIIAKHNLSDEEVKILREGKG